MPRFGVVAVKHFVARLAGEAEVVAVAHVLRIGKYLLPLRLELCFGRLPVLEFLRGSGVVVPQRCP